MQLTFDQLTVAFSVVFAGSILLLLVGTQILDWYWLGFLFAGSFGYGLWRVLHHMPGPYEIAQLIDARLHLYDAVSTAFHFAHASEPVAAEVLAAQSRQAEEAAQSADVRAALPFAWPRFTLLVVALAVGALSLFGIRYLVTNSIDTKPSLVAMAFESFFTPSADRVKEQARNAKRQLDPDFEKLGVQVNNSEVQRNDLDPGNDATNIIDTPDVNNPDGQNGKSKAKTDQVDVKAEGKDAGDEEGEKGKDNADSKGQQSGDQGNSSGDKQQQQQGKQPPKQDNKGDQKGEQSSMLDKMKDAMTNMLNKLKMQGNQQQQQQQQAQNSKDGQQAGKGQQKSDDKGQQDKNGQQGGEGEQKDQKAEAQGQQGQKSESAQGKGGEQGKQPNSPDAKSGVGKSDGNKDIEAAEQAEAMGKISEILGKRQKDVTGEMMIEVSSGKQQLKTGYTNQSGTHKESGGEINRDEVPLIYQQYVERYFDQIHAAKPASAEGAAKPAAAGAVTGGKSAAPAGPAK